MENLIQIEDMLSSKYEHKSYPRWYVFDLRSDKPIFTLESDPHLKKSFDSRNLIKIPHNGFVELYINDFVIEKHYRKFISESKQNRQDLVFKLLDMIGDIKKSIMVVGAESEIIKEFDNNKAYIYMTYDYACMKM